MIAPRALALLALAVSCSAHAWEYRYQIDSMGRGITHFAEQKSSNVLSFGRPYQGEQRALLTIRKNGNGSLSVLVSVNRGQFTCNYHQCQALVRFDNAPAKAWSLGRAADGSHDVIFIEAASRFTEQARKAQRVRIAVMFYTQGEHILDFDLRGLDWLRKDPKLPKKI